MKILFFLFVLASIIFIQIQATPMRDVKVDCGGGVCQSLTIDNSQNRKSE
jgi:hypothetical protein